MERSYTALPHEYRQELSSLSDAAFGKLIRVLLDYSVEGTEPDLQELPKMARIFWPRVKGREDRYRAQFEDMQERYRVRAVKAAETRLRNWENEGRLQPDR